MSLILLPIPSRDFDPSEVAVSWKILTQRGHSVVFATPDGKQGACDPIMLSGIGLDLWSGIPVLRNIRVLGLLLGANADARSAYTEMLRDPAIMRPIRWHRIDPQEFDGLLLGGGHRAQGMREYLESIVLQRITAEFFADEKPVAAIYHGVLLAARSKRGDGRSVLYGRKTTALPWALERKGSALANVGRFWDRNYYRTYTEAVGHPRATCRCSRRSRARSPALRTSSTSPRATPNSSARRAAQRATPLPMIARPGWCAMKITSRRWPGDTHSFARAFAEGLEAKPS